VCFECSTSFSFFRRRHHCRLCGQIFCYDCSNHFVDGQPYGFTGPIRVCTFCSRYIEDAGSQRQTSTGQRASFENGNGAASGGDAIRSAGGTASSGPGSSSRDSLDRRTNLIDPESAGIHPSPLVFGPDPTVAELLAAGTDDDINPLQSPTNSSEDSDVAAPRLDLPPRHRRASSESTAAASTGDAHKNGTNNKGRPHLRSIWRRSSVELIGAIESGGLLDAEIQAILMRKRDKNANEGDNSDTMTGSEPSSGDSKELLHTQREIALDRYMVSRIQFAVCVNGMFTHR
jgi:hypothetical protein